MSSKPQRRTLSKPKEAGVPYASYAQLVRMLLPLTDRVSFYDDRGQVLWISDGLEEPELRMHVEIVLSRAAARNEDDTPADLSSDEHGQPTYVFPIRDLHSELVGAMAIVFRDLPANATYRRLDTVERLLAPLLEVLSHGWHSRLKVEVPVLESHADTLLPLPPVDPNDSPTPLPALLRRTLALATHRLQCAFGAFVVMEKAFTLAHRASPDASGSRTAEIRSNHYPCDTCHPTCRSNAAPHHAGCGANDGRAHSRGLARRPFRSVCATHLAAAR
jgi:hypothetical protein